MSERAREDELGAEKTSLWAIAGWAVCFVALFVLPFALAALLSAL